MSVSHGSLIDIANATGADLLNFGGGIACGLTAVGQADALIQVRGEPFDFAPMKIIIEEAGGRYSTFSGNSSIESGGAIVSNGFLHEQVLRLVRHHADQHGSQSISN